MRNYFKKKNTEAHRMRQDVEAFKVINIGRKGSEKEGGSGGCNEQVDPTSPDNPFAVCIIYENVKMNYNCSRLWNTLSVRGQTRKTFCHKVQETFNWSFINDECIRIHMLFIRMTSQTTLGDKTSYCAEVTLTWNLLPELIHPRS